MPHKWNVNDLIIAVNISHSITETIQNLGLKVAGGNAGTVKKYIEKYKIDTTHFYKLGEMGGMIKSLQKINSYTEEDVFILGWKGSSTPVRRLAKLILEYKCQRCASNGIWNNEPLCLQLDHINGVGTDCRKENLRWLCPNCHSQTPTFGSKNSKNEKWENVCKDCGVKVNTASIRCRNCSATHRRIRTSISINREIFWNTICFNGVRKLAKEYDISERLIKETLKKYNLPWRKTGIRNFSENIAKYLPEQITI
jgi:DNA-directed RNA polymerase subunit RPC12/RpoP